MADTKREQDRWQFEKEGESVTTCAACGQEKEKHAVAMRYEDDHSALATASVKTVVILICPRSTFTPYR